MGVRALWILVGIGLFPATSRADRLLNPGEFVRDGTEGANLRKLATHPSEWAPGLGSSGTRRAGSRSSLSLRDLLGALVITRDLEMPGAPFLGLRVIPTKKALSGESLIPFILRPRLIATSWYGLDVTARF
jgi:hypothetical protein